MSSLAWELTFEKFCWQYQQQHTQARKLQKFSNKIFVQIHNVKSLKSRLLKTLAGSGGFSRGTQARR